MLSVENLSTRISKIAVYITLYYLFIKHLLSEINTFGTDIRVDQLITHQYFIKSERNCDGRDKNWKNRKISVIWLEDMNECIYSGIHSSHYVYSGHQSYSWADVWKPLSIEWIALGPKQHSLRKKGSEYSFIVSSICHHLYCKHCLKDSFCISGIQWSSGDCSTSANHYYHIAIGFSFLRLKTNTK